MAGKVALVIAIVVLFMIGFLPSKGKK
ncbi:hypothetical protein CL3_17730 [butyrate-producing bacterium SM4/1]|nr:hypothetical protein CL3_17730 [butyrate-producing bacterium SM4/1]